MNDICGTNGERAKNTGEEVGAKKRRQLAYGTASLPRGLHRQTGKANRDTQGTGSTVESGMQVMYILLMGRYGTPNVARPGGAAAPAVVAVDRAQYGRREPSRATRRCA